MTTTLKQTLHALCLQQVQQRIDTARLAMEHAQAAANQEGKSSAGDKYETGRAMMQLERDQHARSLAEAQKLRQALEAIVPTRQSKQVQPGSLVRTSGGNFYLAVSLGRLVVQGTDYMAISPITPMGALLMGKGAGDHFVFNQRKVVVLEVL
ncbi:hypothetical protein [Cesiribacter andamanensis]|uniref:3-oxoacyl-ACP synthase n=1 Tax=Cesiribacter andamanensis AMV16 TaxID=1279009 RepID=M7N3Q3_9BACT|nr:hypothetical protein [Cesiribacter andamanensis]EMR01922.1 hypothetical protein ADICEAN_02945 [Cesiribacter andamanensis AMV16]